MENTANWWLFAVLKIVSEYAERVYAYMEKTPRATKLCISQLLIIQILNFFDSFSLHYMGWIRPVKTYHATVPLSITHYNFAKNQRIRRIRGVICARFLKINKQGRWNIYNVNCTVRKL